jgi:short-subunit dehydrogenase involved in D-alanine esterification of teichoic acids
LVAALRAMQAMSSLKNKIAVVIGGSGGIGLATAKRFVGEGADICIAGLSYYFTEFNAD